MVDVVLVDRKKNTTTTSNCHSSGRQDVCRGCCGADDKKYVIGGWAWVWMLVSESQRISLELITVNPYCEDVETAEGVALTVTGVAQIKVMTEHELLALACEQFLGKTVQEIKTVVLQTLEGHLRSILGTLTVEAVFQDRDQFAQLVREVASPDVGRMGIEILSFTIKDVFDNVDYLASLGKSQSALVKRDAEIGVAEAERDAGIREAECKKTMLDVKFDSDTKMANSKREFEMQKADFDQEVNTKVGHLFFYFFVITTILAVNQLWKVVTETKKNNRNEATGRMLASRLKLSGEWQKEQRELDWRRDNKIDHPALWDVSNQVFFCFCFITRDVNNVETF
uniref:Flotillin n=1 Tax=Eptatretus burgeri TaxID=7764 RepID=A0A8C4Q4E2_EPTBU